MKSKITLPNGIKLSGQFIKFNSIFIKFSKTDYGKTLGANIRFSEFKPESMSNEMWVKVLGKDVNNLFHMSVSLDITKYFLNTCVTPSKKWRVKTPQDAVFSNEEQKDLLFTSVIHDWAEAIIGDIPLTSKKESDEDKEMVILHELLHKILGNGRDKQNIDKLANNVKSILTDRSTKLGKAFNAIERIGYLKTAMKAWYLARDSEEELRKKLMHLSTRVVTVHSPKLIEYADIYPAVHSYLLYKQKPISDVFAQNEKRDQELYEKWLNFTTVSSSNGYL